MNRTVKTMIYCALFAALTAVCSQLAIPIQPVPINLALLSVYIAGGLLGGGMGAASQAVFLLIGAVGVPVFAGFRGGVQALVGPTGGYLIGYAAAAFVTGSGRSAVLHDRRRHHARDTSGRSRTCRYAHAPRR